MKISPDAIIAPEKLSRYLLVPLAESDKRANIWLARDFR
jgi:hypothetical protein